MYELESGHAIKGLGVSNATFRVSIANCPPQARYQSLTGIEPLAPGELQHIVANSSNHWRKLFNVYAKLVYALNLAQPGWIAGEFPCWQALRDQQLLQVPSQQALLLGGSPFSAPLPSHEAAAQLTIIAGKTWAQQLGIANKIEWLDAHFAIYPGRPWVVCPYFDYRQLSNARIDQLVEIIVGWRLCPHTGRAYASEVAL